MAEDLELAAVGIAAARYREVVQALEAAQSTSKVAEAKTDALRAEADVARKAMYKALSALCGDTATKAL